MVVASARALVFLRPPALRRPLPYLIAGLGWLSHGGPAGATTDLGPDLGVGLRLPVTPVLAPWVELQCLAITGATAGFAPNLLLSMGVSAKLLGS